MTTPPEPTIERLRHRVYEYRREWAHQPKWIILGQEEWFDVRKTADALELNPTDLGRTGSIPQFMGINVATVPVAHHMEVV